MNLKLGTITKTVGLKGEVKVYSTTSLASRRYKKGNKVYVGETLLTIKSYRKLNSDFDVVSFEELPTIESVEPLLKKDILAEKDDSILKKNEFYYVDLENSDIYANNKNIGKVVSVEEFPSQITLKCKTNDDKEFYVPFIPQFIFNVDIENKKIDINLIEGMLWDLQF